MPHKIMTSTAPKLHLPLPLLHFTDINGHFQKPADDINVGGRVPGQGARDKRPAAGHGEGEQELVGQVLADGNLVRQILFGLPHRIGGNRFGAHAALAKAGEYFGHMLASDLDGDDIPRPLPFVQLADLQRFVRPAQLLANHFQFAQGDPGKPAQMALAMR